MPGVQLDPPRGKVLPLNHDLLQRVQQFLPAIKQANEALSADAGTLDDCLEAVSDHGDESESTKGATSNLRKPTANPVIEMNLGVGVFDCCESVAAAHSSQGQSLEALKSWREPSMAASSAARAPHSGIQEL